MQRSGLALDDMATKKAGKSILLIAFHFPPLGESSGLQCT